MFLNEKDGYNKQQVNEKIFALNNKIENLQHALDEKDKLNLGLASALEKSKQIEVSSKNLYELKMQKIIILYKNFAKSLNTLFSLYPQIEELEDLKKCFVSLAQAIESSCYTTSNKNISPTINTDNDTMRLLLKKMSTHTPPSTISQAHTIKRKDSRHFSASPTQAKTNILHLDTSSDGFESPAEKFLQTGKTEDNAYTKILNHKNPDDLYPTPNESGFDLREAVNPKDDLEEIMKAFNLDETQEN